MLHPSVERELFGRRGRLEQGEAVEDKQAPLPRRHIAIAVLMMMVLGCWAMDLMHLQVVPTPMHQRVTDYIDSARQRWPSLSCLPDVDDAVAHSPIDGSPITFGSMMLLGALCVAGLAGMVFSTNSNERK